VDLRTEQDSGTELGTKLTVKPYCKNEHMLREVHILILLCGDMSEKVRMFCAHTWEMLRAGRFVVGGSHALDYGRRGL